MWRDWNLRFTIEFGSTGGIGVEIEYFGDFKGYGVEGYLAT